MNSAFSRLMNAALGLFKSDKIDMLERDILICLSARSNQKHIEIIKTIRILSDEVSDAKIYCKIKYMEARGFVKNLDGLSITDKGKKKLFDTSSRVDQDEQE